MAGQGIALPIEDDDEVRRVFETIRAELGPEGDIDEALARRVALFTIRLDRSALNEAAAISAKMRTAEADFDDARLDEVDRLMALLAEDPAPAVRKLRRMPEGVDRMIDAWLGLRADLACRAEDRSRRRLGRPDPAAAEAGPASRALEIPPDAPLAPRPGPGERPPGRRQHQRRPTLSGRGTIGRGPREGPRAGLRYELFDRRPYGPYHGSCADRRPGARAGLLVSPWEVRPMHIPDAVLDPRVAAATGLIAAGGLAYSLHRLKDRLKDRTTVLMGSMAAFVFAAQMVNFPLYPFPISGHLLGGVLAAVLLGPWAGAAVVAAVLLVQCFLFGDGGLTALGANFINMGLIGSVGGYALYTPIRRAIGGRRGVLIGAMAAAWFAVILASGAFAVELAASGRWADFPSILGWMALVHAAIGLGEALITGAVVRFLLLTRPDLLDDPGGRDDSRAARWGGVAVAGLGISVAVAIFLGPMASKHPDGLDFVGGPARLGFLPEGGAAAPSPFPDYEVPGLAGYNPAAATAAAGLIGTLAVFGVGLVLARAFAGRGEAGGGGEAPPGPFGEGVAANAT